MGIDALCWIIEIRLMSHFTGLFVAVWTSVDEEDAEVLLAF